MTGPHSYGPPVWRLMIDPPADPTWNMAVDRILLIPPETPPEEEITLRFYGWSPPAVSLGRFQPPLPRAGVDFCRRAGIRVVRRPTGGGGVLHADEVTYSLSGPLGGRFFPRSVIRIYRRIAAALCRGLENLGVVADCGPEGDAVRPSLLTQPCFSRLGRWEIRWQDRKLIGSAQARHGGRFLQHGSIPIRFDRARLCRAFGLDPVAGPDIPATSLQEALGRTPDRSEVLEGLIEGFRQEFGADMKPGGLTGPERVRFSADESRGSAAPAALPEPAGAGGAAE